MKKIIVRGVLGGLALFVWSFIAHLPPAGTAGERNVAPAQDDVVLRALGGAMRERAIYILPRFDRGAAKYAAGPAAVVAFNPHPAPPGSWFVIEFAGAIVVGLLGAVIAANLSRALRYWPRVFILAAVGVIATIDVDVSYWNWYGFPTSYLFAQLLDHAGGWLAAGMVITSADR